MDRTELLAIRKRLTAARRHEIVNEKRQAARPVRRRMTLAAAAWMAMMRKVLNAKVKAGLRGKTAKEIADNLVDWKMIEDQGRRIFLSTIDIGHGAGWKLAAPRIAKYRIEKARLAKAGGGTAGAGSSPGPYIPLVGPQPQAAYAWSLDHTGKLVVEITEQTRQAIIGFVAPRLLNGKSNQTIARDLRTNNIVGLTEKQMAAAGNYWTKLVDNGMDEGTADERAGRYADRLLAYRTDMIARTETSFALNEGIRSAYKENDIKYLERVEDPEACIEICREENGKIYTVEEAEGVLPAHPNCEGTWVYAEGPDEGDTRIPAEEIQMMAKQKGQFDRKTVSPSRGQARKRLTKRTRPTRLTRSRLSRGGRK
jgi:SPP1 gp7 family putative phage head morphogenesis protein